MATQWIKHQSPAIFSLREQLVEAGVCQTLRAATAMINKGLVYLRVDEPSLYFICVANPDATLLLSRATVLRLAKNDDIIYLQLIPKQPQGVVYAMSEEEKRNFYGEALKYVEQKLNETIVSN